MTGPLANPDDVAAGEKVGQPSPGPRGPIGRRTRPAGGRAATSRGRVLRRSGQEVPIPRAPKAPKAGGVVTGRSYRHCRR